METLDTERLATDEASVVRAECSDGAANEQVPTAATPQNGKSKGGAPPLNRNAFRHGLYSPRGPKGTAYTDRAANEFRRHLEDQVLAVHGEISTLAASLIQTAAEATRVAIAELTEIRELCEAEPPLEPQHRTAKRQAALKALDLRDRKVKELGITWKPDAPAAAGDPWEAFDDERKLSTATAEVTPCP